MLMSEPVWLPALLESIAVWEDKLTKDSPEQMTIGAANCPLCVKYLSSLCSGCPIQAKTNCSLCETTPYREAYNALGGWQHATDAIGITQAQRGLVYKYMQSAEPIAKAAFRQAAQGMIDFMKALVPSGESVSTASE